MMLSRSNLFKILIFLLAVSLASTTLIGCSKKKEVVKRKAYITDDTEWYEHKTIVEDASVVGTQEIYLSRLLTADNTYRIYEKVYDESDEDFKGSIIFLDSNNSTFEFNLGDINSDTWYVQLADVFRIEENYYAVINCIERGPYKTYIYQLDFDTSSFVEVLKVDFSDTYTSATVSKVRYHDSKYYMQFSYTVKDKIYDSFAVYDEISGDISYFDINFGDVSWWVFDSDESISAVIYDQTANEDTRYSVYKININKNESTLLYSNSELFIDKSMTYLTDDGKMYAISEDLKLTYVDIKSGKESVAMDFNNTSLNLHNVQTSCLVYYDEDTVILGKETYYPTEPLDYTMFYLNKAETNPNVGKQIIYAAPYDVVDSLSGSAIAQFNSQNKDAYIYITMDYSWRTFDDYERTDDYLTTKHNRDFNLMSVLKQDIRNGYGPDILLGFGSYDVLYNEDYLVDLFDVINDPTRFNKEEYFSNIFDAFVINGKLYQIPLSATVLGLYVDDNTMWSESKGMTFSDYKAYRDNECNGVDFLGVDCGRDYAFDFMIKSFYNELHDDNGLLALDNDTFRNICDLAKDMGEASAPGVTLDEGQLIEFYRLTYDLTRMIIKDEKEFVGFPSVDGKSGPVVNPYQSVAITSCAIDSDLAFEFVNSLLSYDVQVQNTIYNPVNKAAFEYYATNSLEAASTHLKDFYGIAETDFTGKLELYEEYLSSANGCYLYNDYAMLIMHEEIQAYFSDQKSIDEVIAIVESRVNTMLTENE